MDDLVRKIEIPLACNIIRKAGLYLVPENRLDELAEIAADAYHDYPLHNWFTNGIYDPIASKLMNPMLRLCVGISWSYQIIQGL